MKFKLVTTFLIAFVSVTLLVFNVSADSEKVDNDTIMEVNEYKSYLKEKSKENPEALEALEKFNNLKQSEKTAFLEVLSSMEYMEMLSDGQTLDDNQKISQTIKTNSGIEVPVTIENADEQRTSNQPTGVRTWARGGFDLTLLGIKVARYHTTVTWEKSGGAATKHLDTEHNHYNINPGVWTNKQPETAGYVSNGYAYGTGNWSLRSTGALGAISFDLSVKIKGKTENLAYKKLTATHFNIKNTGWQRFAY